MRRGSGTRVQIIVDDSPIVIVLFARQRTELDRDVDFSVGGLARCGGSYGEGDAAQDLGFAEGDEGGSVGVKGEDGWLEVGVSCYVMCS